MLEKIRPNVLVLAVFITLIEIILLGGTFAFLNSFAPDSPFWDGAVLGAVVTLFVTLQGVALGGLVSTMSSVAQDAPPPTVPAAVHQALVDKVVKS